MKHTSKSITLEVCTDSQKSESYAQSLAILAGEFNQYGRNIQWNGKMQEFEQLQRDFEHTISRMQILLSNANYAYLESDKVYKIRLQDEQGKSKDRYMLASAKNVSELLKKIGSNNDGHIVTEYANDWINEISHTKPAGNIEIDWAR
jgi:hypothetical protein